MKRLITLTVAVLCLGGLLSEAKCNKVVIQSKYLHCDDTIAVFSPAGKQKVKNLKTVFVLHGYSGCWRDWSIHMDLQKLADKTGWRIITPDGFYASWYINNANPEKMQYRSFFWEEAWPEIDRLYGLKPEVTAITGLSMGGHGAMNIFLDHPELFVGGGSMSGVLTLESSSENRAIAVMLGRENALDCKEFSAIARLENLTALGHDNGKIVVVTCGTEDDQFRPVALDFAGRCQELGIKYTLMLSQGGHDWVYWPYILKYHLGWFDEQIQENATR